MTLYLSFLTSSSFYFLFLSHSSSSPSFFTWLIHLLHPASSSSYSTCLSVFRIFSLVLLYNPSLPSLFFLHLRLFSPDLRWITLTLPSPHHPQEDEGKDLPNISQGIAFKGSSPSPHYYFPLSIYVFLSSLFPSLFSASHISFSHASLLSSLKYL